MTRVWGTDSQHVRPRQPQGSRRSHERKRRPREEQPFGWEATGAGVRAETGAGSWPGSVPHLKQGVRPGLGWPRAPIPALGGSLSCGTDGRRPRSRPDRGVPAGRGGHPEAQPTPGRQEEEPGVTLSQQSEVGPLCQCAARNPCIHPTSRCHRCPRFTGEAEKERADRPGPRRPGDAQTRALHPSLSEPASWS